jgi:xanthine dehydrogenase small subunit
VPALAEDFKQLTDLRASSEYRLRGAGNLLRRFYLQFADEHGRSACATGSATATGSANAMRTADLATGAG